MKALGDIQTRVGIGLGVSPGGTISEARGQSRERMSPLTLMGSALGGPMSGVES